MAEKLAVNRAAPQRRDVDYLSAALRNLTLPTAEKKETLRFKWFR